MGVVVSTIMSNEVVVASFVDPMTTVGKIVPVLEVRSMTPVRTRGSSLLLRNKWLKLPEPNGPKDLRGSPQDILGQSNHLMLHLVLCGGRITASREVHGDSIISVIQRMKSGQK